MKRKNHEKNIDPYKRLRELYNKILTNDTPYTPISDPKTDSLVFKLLKESHTNLKEAFVLEKIFKWQRDLRSNDEVVVFNAGDKLKKIGTTLTLKKRKNYFDLILERDKIYKKIKKAKIAKLRSEAYQREKLEKLFGKKIIDILDIIPSTNSELANVITGAKMGYSGQTVSRHTKGKNSGYIKLMKELQVVD